MVVINTEIGRGKGSREVTSWPLEPLPGWLFGIDSSRVKPEFQEKIKRYRAECFPILWEAFQNQTFAVSDLVEPDASELVQIREMGLAIAKMADQQIELVRKVTKAHSRLDKAAIVFKGLDDRLSAVEKKLSRASLITDEQAEEISGTVKALAEYLTGKGKSKNWYQGIFAELYRRFRVSIYKNIRVDQCPKGLEFLEDWPKSADTTKGIWNYPQNRNRV